MALVRRALEQDTAAMQPRTPPPCRSQHARATAEAEPGDLGREIATATLNAARCSTDERGVAFEVADPEPLLRGVASAYAAIAQTLPGGLDEAWALLGLLALELEDAGRSSSSPPDTSGLPWPEHRELRTRDRDKVAVAAETGTNAAAHGSAWLTLADTKLAGAASRRPRPRLPRRKTELRTPGDIPLRRRLAIADRHIAETEAHLVHQATLIGQMAAQGRPTNLPDTLLWLTGQTLDALHEHRRTLLSEAAQA